MKIINQKLMQKFQNYSEQLDKILGKGLVEPSQVKQIYENSTNILKQYKKGAMVFKNGIDGLRYLLQHKDIVAKNIGLTSSSVDGGKEISDNKRNLGKIKEYLQKMQYMYEIGDSSQPI